MNASLPPLAQLIETLREAMRMPPENWGRVSRTVEQLPRVTIAEAGDAAAVLSISAKSLLRQLPHVQQETHSSMREAMKHMADALQMELNALGERPYHIDRS